VTAEDLARVQATLDQERTMRREAEAQLERAKAAGLSDHEKAVAAARAEGRAEAESAAARALAGAEFRIMAAGKIASPEAALGALDLGKLLDKNGQPDKAKIAALVEQLAAAPAPPAPPAPPGPRGAIPPGPRAPAPGAGDGDWLRNIQRPGGRRRR
jgi:hypothetical protein